MGDERALVPRELGPKEKTNKTDLMPEAVCTLYVCVHINDIIPKGFNGLALYGVDGVGREDTGESGDKSPGPIIYIHVYKYCDT